MSTDRMNAHHNNRRDAQAIVDLVKGIEARCMAADIVTPTEHEISQEETARLLRLSWRLARRYLAIGGLGRSLVGSD